MRACVCVHLTFHGLTCHFLCFYTNLDSPHNKLNNVDKVIFVKMARSQSACSWYKKETRKSFVRLSLPFVYALTSQKSDPKIIIEEIKHA